MCSATWPAQVPSWSLRDEAAAAAERAGVVLEGRQEVDERVGEARDLVRRELLEDAEVDDHPDDRLAGPVVGAAQDAGLEDPERRLGAAAVRQVRRASSCVGAVARGLPARARFRCRLRHGPSCRPVSPFAGPECNGRSAGSGRTGGGIHPVRGDAVVGIKRVGLGRVRTRRPRRLPGSRGASVSRGGGDGAGRSGSRRAASAGRRRRSSAACGP